MATLGFYDISKLFSTSHTTRQHDANRDFLTLFQIWVLDLLWHIFVCKMFKLNKRSPSCLLKKLTKKLWLCFSRRKFGWANVFFQIELGLKIHSMHLFYILTLFSSCTILFARQLRALLCPDVANMDFSISKKGCFKCKNMHFDRLWNREHLFTYLTWSFFLPLLYYFRRVR